MTALQITSAEIGSFTPASLRAHYARSRAEIERPRRVYAICDAAPRSTTGPIHNAHVVTFRRYFDGPPLDDIIEAVCCIYRVRRIDIMSHRRNGLVIEPRHVAMYLCRELTTASFLKLGRHFGKRDHTSIMHGWRRIDQDQIRLASRLAKIVAHIEANA